MPQKFQTSEKTSSHLLLIKLQYEKTPYEEANISIILKKKHFFSVFFKHYQL